MEKFVITIGREYGSGGRGIAHRLADALPARCHCSLHVLCFREKPRGNLLCCFRQNDPLRLFHHALL